MTLRLLIFLHRWVGVALCLVFLLWFPSGIGMMYWTFPAVSNNDRLDHSPKLNPAKIMLSPTEAAGKVGIQKISPDEIRLNTFDGRPVYRLGGGRGDSHIVYADTGEEQTEVSSEMRHRIAAAWTGQPTDQASLESVEEVDQWTVSGRLRNLRPLYKYSWPDGQQVYIAGHSGEVVQYTTFGTRLAAHVSAIPHWIYYTPLRKNQRAWVRFVVWTSGIGTISAIIGIVIGAWMYSPKRKYRLAGKPTGIPYRGQKRWHTILGLIFGIATVTWTFSGMLSMDPFPSLQSPPPAQSAGDDSDTDSRPSVADGLRGRVAMADFESVHPRDLLAKVPSLDVRELEYTSFAGRPVLAANLKGGKTQMIELDGTLIPEFDHQQITGIVKASASNPQVVETAVIDQYDFYYLDRTREAPLPVIRALMNDADKTRYYIDPKTAQIVMVYSERDWFNRWFYNGLHSLNFPWLYNYRPLWDIVVIAFMLGGTALCVTSLVLAWRVLGRTLKRSASGPNDVLTAAE